MTMKLLLPLLVFLAGCPMPSGMQAATRSTTVELCSVCDQPAKYRVELKRESALVYDPVTGDIERTYRPAGFAHRCWGHNWCVLPMTEADKRTSISVAAERGWEYKPCD